MSSKYFNHMVTKRQYYGYEPNSPNKISAHVTQLLAIEPFMGMLTGVALSIAILLTASFITNQIPSIDLGKNIVSLTQNMITKPTDGDGTYLSTTLTNATVSNVLSRINITSLNRFNGTDRLLDPVFARYQRDMNGQAGGEWNIFYYVWKENPKHFDIEAVVGILPVPDGYIIEIGKLTGHGIRIDIDNQTHTIPPATFGEVSSGFLSLRIPA